MSAIGSAEWNMASGRKESSGRGLMLLTYIGCEARCRQWLIDLFCYCREVGWLCMIIWLFVAVFAFFVNLPHIVRKRIVKKLASQEYREQRKYASLKGGSLKIIEWFNLYPLKKALVSTLWLLGVYASIRGVVLVWITHRKDFVWITAFFFLLPYYPLVDAGVTSKCHTIVRLYSKRCWLGNSLKNYWEMRSLT